MVDLSLRESFLFDLPEDQIADRPVEPRDASRLLVLRNQHIEHAHFRDLSKFLKPGDLLIVNDVRVQPARLFARKASGGLVEALALDWTPLDKGWKISAMAKSNRPLKRDQRLWLQSDGDQNIPIYYRGKSDKGLAIFEIQWENPIEQLFEAMGEMPLPPYIVKKRKHKGLPIYTAEDKQSYQTIYAQKGKAVAAPTAGLHFTPKLMEDLKARGIDWTSIRLDVGAGTFQPVRESLLDRHVMHEEYYELSGAFIQKYRSTLDKGGRCIAVGTTVVRALEDQWLRHGSLKEGRYSTKLFIRPGHVFKTIHGMITNFHLPGSTLIVLVAALAGYEPIMQAYREAVQKGYRFYSYGDAMLILPHEY